MIDIAKRRSNTKEFSYESKKLYGSTVRRPYCCDQCQPCRCDRRCNAFWHVWHGLWFLKRNHRYFKQRSDESFWINAAESGISRPLKGHSGNVSWLLPLQTAKLFRWWFFLCIHFQTVWNLPYWCFLLYRRQRFHGHRLKALRIWQKNRQSCAYCRYSKDHRQWSLWDRPYTRIRFCRKIYRIFSFRNRTWHIYLCSQKCDDRGNHGTWCRMADRCFCTGKKRL